jgi:glyoxalase/bleomycin resistance protein/dioxygenase superfamily protein
MGVTGLHALIYTPAADELRTLLSDAFGFSHVDAGEGWLVFALPPAELGVHPGSESRYELSLMCDDITSTMTELRSKGVEFDGEPAERGWGRAVTMTLPGGVEMLLYQPHHPAAH